MNATEKPLEITTETARFTLSWDSSGESGACLKFSNTVWPLFVDAAKKRGIDPEEMISVAVAQLVGKIIRYRLRD